MTRRLTVLFLLAALLATGSAVPGATLASDPAADGSITSASGRVLPPLPTALLEPSIHAQMLSEDGAGAFAFTPGGEPTIVLDPNGTPVLRTDGAQSTTGADGSVGALTAPLTVSGLPNGLRKEVFGFLPYWMLTDSALQHMNYSLVSTIAYFSVALGADGYLNKGTTSGWSGWTSSRMTQVLDRAHSRGVKVVLTVTHMAWNGDYSRMTDLLTSSTRRTRAVNQIVNAVVARGADGVNLDFEPVPTSLRDEYVTFVRQLKAALSAAGSGDFLTVCVMAGAATWATGYDVARLTAGGAADALFVMGYDYHWSGSSRAGGVAPIESPYTIDVNGTMLDFLAETSGSKLIWGVPYYGREWPTSSGVLNSTTRGGDSVAWQYTGHLAQAARYGRRWDDVGKVPWYRWKNSSGRWFQGYYDDVASLGLKYDLVNARGLRGTGMWTLLMDQGRTDLWRLLADKFVNDTAPPAGGIELLPPVIDGTRVRVRWNAVDHATGVDHYNVQYRRIGGTWTKWISNTTAESAWFSGSANARYEFRVQAVDLKGNRQPWISTPSKPSNVRAGAFARVLTGTLNVRAGPGTGHTIIDTATRDDVAYVLEGPVSGSGLQWFRVQYGFGEWPSAEFASVGWMAAGASEEPYLAPSLAPTRTLLRPFVHDVTAPAAFSPNGDGRADSATIGFALSGAADAVRLEVLDLGGAVVRSLDLGALGAGEHEVTWNGRDGSGAVVSEGGYVPRVVATDANGNHFGPAKNLTSAVIADYAMQVDVTAPSTRWTTPDASATHHPATRRVVVKFSEKMLGTGPSGAYLRLADGTNVPATNVLKGNGTRLVIHPAAPLPTDALVTVKLAGRVRDLASNRHGWASWSFRTAPGVTFEPPRSARIANGPQYAYRIGTAAELVDRRRGRWPDGTTLPVGQRSRMANLPGRWLYVEEGRFDGFWLRESADAHLRGEAERVGLAEAAVRVRAGRHVGYRFDARGRVTDTRSRFVDATHKATADGRLIVNGVAYLSITSGPWSGYLLPESATAHARGAVDRIPFPSRPAIVIRAGTHTGYDYRPNGSVRSRVTRTLDDSLLAHARAWAVINGVPHLRVDDGPWAGTWVPEAGAIRMAF